MIKIQVPEFNEVNKYIIEHAFLTDILKNDSIDLIIKKHFHNGKFVLLNQIHSNICHVVKKEIFVIRDGDALVTQDHSIALCLFHADCVPILFVDSINKIIGAAHAGWRGAKSGIVREIIKEMKKLGAKTDYIRTLIGPCIQQMNYEVSQQFHDDFLKEAYNNRSFFIEEDKKFFFNLSSYVKKQLETCKINKNNIYDSKIDTYSNNGIASYRRDTRNHLPNDHTNISLIMLRNHNNYESDQSLECDISNEWIQYTDSIKKTDNNKITLFREKNANFTERLEGKVDNNLESKGKLQYLNNHDARELIKKIQKRIIHIEDKIDLHGLTLDEAFIRVKNFVLDNYTRRRRYLLIIAGKGKDNNGLIRSNIREWLENDLKIIDKISLIEEALPQHGGNGSFYVFLRKAKDL